MQMLISQSINLHSSTSMTEFTRDYYGMDPLIGESAVHTLSYKELTPLFLFNVWKQSERFNQGVVDISVEMQFSVKVEANKKKRTLSL